MSAVLGDRASTNPGTSWMPWLPVAAGLAILYVPTYVRLSGWIWRLEEQGHGPLILAVVAWLLWQKRAVLLSAPRDTMPLAGSILLGLGLLCYAVGRSQEIALLEVGSQIPVLLGIVAVLIGRHALRQMAFPICFLVFMVPLPGFVIDGVTASLKQHVSAIAEQLLYWAGYPIGRSGVILSIGPYQLLVADACSGLHSMYSLSALGLLYLYLMKYDNRLRNLILILSILPIAFAANVVRVLFLVLITYHFGDAAAQGMVHDFTGLGLFVVALVLLFALDYVVGLALSRRAASTRA